jgi:hypothetical protein
MPVAGSRSYSKAYFSARDKPDNRISKSMKAIWGAQAASLSPIGCQPMATRSFVSNLNPSSFSFFP